VINRKSKNVTFYIEKNGIAITIVKVYHCFRLWIKSQNSNKFKIYDSYLQSYFGIQNHMCLVCFYVLKAFLKKIKFIFFLCFKLIYFFCIFRSF